MTLELIAGFAFVLLLVVAVALTYSRRRRAYAAMLEDDGEASVRGGSDDET